MSETPEKDVTGSPQSDATEAPRPAGPPEKRRRKTRARRISECPICAHHLKHGDPRRFEKGTTDFTDWARSNYELAMQQVGQLTQLREKLRTAEQLLELQDARKQKVLEARAAAIERLTAMLPLAEKQAAEGKTALLRLILRALR